MKAEELFKRVTSDLVATIEAGAGDWRMPWHRLGVGGAPVSVDGRAYRGFNALVLAMVAGERGWGSTWGTYRGWQRHDGQVRRGERGTHVVLWKPAERARPDDTDDADDTGSADDRDDHAGGGGRRRRLLARTFTVFAAEQVDGADHRPPAPDPVDEPRRLAGAEAYFTAVGAKMVEGGTRACYVPTQDLIRLPGLARFGRADHYYSTAAHEHTHWTGHRSRLGRDLAGRFGDRAYAAEELVAELGAAFWCAQIGLEAATRSDHADYLADWLSILRADTRALVSACGHAQRALDHLNTAAGWTATPGRPAADPA